MSLLRAYNSLGIVMKRMDDWQSGYHYTIQSWGSKQCTWCTGPIRGESFTITFPEKDQAFFHVECLYRYREVMDPPAAQ